MAKKTKLNKKNILVGVCGGIASYKTVQLVRLLAGQGCSVKVMMTESATKFVTPLVFQTVSGHPVYVDMFTPYKDPVTHISLADWADICVIAPLSANTLSKFACGICDNLLTTVVCALPRKTKLLCVPAMNQQMWRNPVIAANALRLKKESRCLFIQPSRGALACGIYGEGRMPEAGEILEKLQSLVK